MSGASSGGQHEDDDDHQARDGQPAGGEPNPREIAGRLLGDADDGHGDRDPLVNAHERRTLGSIAA